MKIGLLKHAIDHIVVPVDEYQLHALRNAVVCGVLTFVIVVVGLSQFLLFAVYLLAIALACITAWMYTLKPDVRKQVMGRVRYVATAFWRNCVDESFGAETDREGVDGTRDTAGSSSSNTGTVIGTDEQPKPGKTDVHTDAMDHSDEEIQEKLRVHELSQEFASCFQLNSDD